MQNGVCLSALSLSFRAVCLGGGRNMSAPVDGTVYQAYDVM